MDSTFTLFPRLPPEIRQQIWRDALTQDWSFTHFTRVNEDIKMIGKVHRAVGHACREARAVMQTTHTNVHDSFGWTDTSGWIDFSRHLFFFRDAQFNRSLMLDVDSRYSMLAHVQHLVIYPRDWAYLWHTIDVLGSYCISLRTLVLVGPWRTPPITSDLDLAPPHEDWGSLFHRTPTEINPQVLPLLDDIENGNAANIAINAQYQAELEKFISLIPGFPGEIWGLDYAYRSTQDAVRRLEQAVQDFPFATPSLYFRKKDNLGSPIMSIES